MLFLVLIDLITGVVIQELWSLLSKIYLVLNGKQSVYFINFGKELTRIDVNILQ